MVEGLRRELNWLKNTSITTSKVEKRLNLRWGNMTKDLEWKRTVKVLNLREIPMLGV